MKFTLATLIFDFNIALECCYFSCYMDTLEELDFLDFSEFKSMQFKFVLDFYFNEELHDLSK